MSYQSPRSDVSAQRVANPPANHHAICAELVHCSWRWVLVREAPCSHPIASTAEMAASGKNQKGSIRNFRVVIVVRLLARNGPNIPEKTLKVKALTGKNSNPYLTNASFSPLRRTRIGAFLLNLPVSNSSERGSSIYSVITLRTGLAPNSGSKPFSAKKS